MLCGHISIATVKKYGVAKNAVSHGLKKKAEIFETVEESNVSKKSKRMKAAIREELHTAMYKWLKNARHSNALINSNIFKEKALEFAKSLEFHDFHASDVMDVWVDGKNFSMSVSKLLHVNNIFTGALEVIASICL